MEKLTGIEFIPATDKPQLVRLKRRHDVVDEVVFDINAWLWVGLSGLSIPFDSRADLIIEGEGIANLFWNDEIPLWTLTFDGAAEERRIDRIRLAALQALHRGSVLLMG